MIKSEEKILAFIFLFIILFLNGFGNWEIKKKNQEVGFISGRVFDDETSTPLSFTKIRTHNKTADTDKNGYYQIFIEPGIYNLNISKDFYISKLASDIIVTADQITTINISLNKSRQWQMFGGGNEHTRNTPLTNKINTPGVAWKYKIKSTNPKLLTINDVNNDGANDILTLHGERLYVFNGDGSLLWESRGDVGNEIGTLVGILDLNNDGIKDIVCGNKPSEDTFGFFRMARLTILNGNDGSIQYSHSFFDKGINHCISTGYGTANSISKYNTKFADVDEDSDLELIIFPDFANEYMLFDFSNDIKNPIIKYSKPYLRNAFPGFVVGDIDGDNIKEIVGDWFGLMYVFNAKNGIEKYRYKDFDTEETAGTIVLTNVDDDINNEIIKISPTGKSITVFDAETTGVAIKWQRDNLGYLIFPENCINDVDGDGDLEIIIGVNKDKMYIFNAKDGSIEWSIPQRLPNGLADVDGDGILEILTGTSTIGNNPYIYDGKNNNYAEKANFSGQRWIKGTDEYSSDSANNFYYALSYPYVGYLKKDVITQSNGTIYSYRFNNDVPELNWTYPTIPFDNKKNITLTVGDVDKDGLDETIIFADDGTLRILDEHGKEQSLTYINFGGLTLPKVVDLNNDGKNEIIIMSASNKGSPSEFYEGTMKILDASKADLSNPPNETGWGFNDYYIDNYAYQYWTPVIADLEGDGKQEIILMTDAATIKVINYDGTVKWSYTFNNAVYLGVGFYNSDSILDILTADVVHNFRILDGRNGSLIWSDKKPSSWIPTILDINSDGIDDIVALGTGQYVYAYSGIDGSLLWSDNSNCAMCNNGTISIGDIDGDGENELVTSGNFGTVAYELNGKLIWEQKNINSEGFKNYFAALCDINNDGAVDIIQPSNHGVYAFDGRNGEKIWHFYPQPKVAVSSIVISDINGDSQEEIIFGCNDGYLRALNKKDGSEIWKIFLGYQITSPIIADTDNDGEGEILVSVNGYLYCLDKNQPVVSGIYKNCTNIICSDGTIAYSDYPTTSSAAVNMQISSTANIIYIDIRNWETPENIKIEWYEYTDSQEFVVIHTIGDLNPNRYYQVIVNNSVKKIQKSNEFGEIIFADYYSGNGYKRLYEIKETIIETALFMLY